jgi:hypothetical protein
MIMILWECGSHAHYGARVHHRVGRGRLWPWHVFYRLSQSTALIKSSGYALRLVVVSQFDCCGAELKQAVDVGVENSLPFVDWAVHNVGV